MPRGNPTAIALGPGYLFWAVLGSAEPTDLTTPWDADWIPIGYTQEGSTFSYQPAFEDVEVAEELDPLDSIATSRQIQVSFSAAQVTAANYKLAMNGGTITLEGSAPDQFLEFEPPALGEETTIMLGYESEDHLERWVYRQCKQVGNIETARRKGADKGLVPMEFRVYAPSTGLKPFKFLNARTGAVI